MSATINVGEDDFTAVSSAAIAAFRRGDEDEAAALDKIARKINAALTGVTTRRALAFTGVSPSTVSWKDMPSVLECLKSPDGA